MKLYAGTISNMITKNRIFQVLSMSMSILKTKESNGVIVLFLQG